MKILHTSDWHLGHTLYEHDRTEEQAAFIDQLCDIVSEEKPHALLVSGDIYDRTNPSTAVQRLYYKGLLRLHSVCPDMRIVVTAGNHDSKSMLELGSDLWALAGVKVIGQVERTENGPDIDRHMVEITNAAGETEGFVVAVPHIFEHSFPIMDGAAGKADRKRFFFQTLLDRVKELNVGEFPVVMMAHLTLNGSYMVGQDADVVGGINESAPEELGSGFDYLALGHIHCPQNIRCNGAVARYCGAPVPVSFDEDFPHSVSLVTLEKGKTPEIKEIRIENRKPLLTVPSRPVSFAKALKRLDDIGTAESCYIRLNVSLDAPLPADYAEQIAQALHGKKAAFCCCKITRKEEEVSEEDVRVTYDEFQELTPVTVAHRFYKSKYGCDMPADLSDRLVEAIRRYEMNQQEL